jgi:preprotein translocase subunit SecY
MFDMIAGGSLARMTIFALAIMPYITSSIIIQLSTIVFKTFEEFKKEGEAGKRKLNQYTRYLTILICILQSYGIASALEAMNSPYGNLVLIPGIFFKISTVTTLTAGTVFLLWLADRITLKKIGNGTSIIIFSGIVSSLPTGVYKLFTLAKTGSISFLTLLFIVLISILTLYFVVLVEKTVRKIVIQYAKRQVGNKLYGGQSSFLPIKLNSSGVIPPIFASSLLLFPTTLTAFAGSNSSEISLWINANLSHGKPLFLLAYAILIIVFSFFYSGVAINPEDTAENLRKNGAIIPGKKPGALTAKYIKYVTNRITVLGAFYLVIICIMPEVILGKISVPIYVGGTAILIVVSVVIEAFTQIQTQLYVGQYKKLINKK